MRIRRKLLMAACLAVVPGMAVTATAAAGTAAAAGHHAGGRTAGRVGAGRAARRRPAAHRARVALSGLSAQQLAGQRVIYSYPGLTPPASLISLIEHGEAAGVIFFGQNISSESQIAGVIKKLEQADASSLNPVRAPLLLMTDQEGGEVRRLPGRPYLSEKEIGANPLPQAEKLATEAGQGAAANLHGVGMNVNLAPVLDVYRKAGDFDDQYGRSYSMNPTVVSDLGTRMLRAQQAGGVASAVKHFPGLGAATKNQNTDVRPVTLNLSLNTLRTVDEVPFAAAVQAGVKMVMVSWAIYPALGARPAGFSPNVVQGELRDRLHFTGVTITDALEAGALNPFGSIQHRALRAAIAGMDLMLASGQRVTEGRQAAGELATAYSSGALGQASFRAAVNRVIALRQSL
jgi:beta-N-acetylhexosaminidase